MSNFKRVSLAGSEELFRPTRPTVLEDSDDTLAELVDRKPKERHYYHTVQLSPEEVDLLLEAIQAAKYPDRARGKLPLEKFGRYDALRDKLQSTD